MDVADLALLTRWLAQPHVRAWWKGEPQTLLDVTAKYGSRLGGGDLDSLVITADDEPVGMLERYPLASEPEWAQVLARAVDVTSSAGIDYLVGEPAACHRGIATAAIKHAVETMPVPWSVSRVLVAVQQANTWSWRALERAGFNRVWAGVLVSDDPSDAGPAYILERSI